MFRKMIFVLIFQKTYQRLAVVVIIIIIIIIIRGVAKNKYLGGAGCNRNILNIILKSIGYKIIDFHISSYT